MQQAVVDRHSRIDANKIIPRLYQGSRPPMGWDLVNAGVTSLVLCAEEHQPRAKNFPGILVCHAPLDDHMKPLSRIEWNTIQDAARFVVRELGRGGRVLVTCHAGRNRSGIVTALALIMLTGCTGREAVRLIKAHRENALSNPSFAQQIERIR